jgi:hypothetical protein
METWRREYNMNDVKIFLTCLFLSFIVGAYTVVLVNKDRYGCTVEVRDVGGTIHVFSGKVY